MEQKPRAVVCGVGHIGKAIIFCMTKLGFHVIALDRDKDAAKHLPDQLFDFLVTPNQESMEKAILLSQPHVVISSLPYHQTQQVAEYCIRNKHNYCDLGGKVRVSQKINQLANSSGNSPDGFHVFTDLGLAPGWVNILAEHGRKQLHGKFKDIKNIKMMVGGIPDQPRNPPLNYVMTWSLDGLINEYKDKCKILINGQESWVDGMEGLEEVNTKSRGDLEAFYTSGGASHSIESMKSAGVQNCSYKTLRYKGHRDIVRFLIKDSKLSQECLGELFKNTVTHGVRVLDIVIIKVTIDAGDTSWDQELLIPNGSVFSAMQKSTAFAISSVAKMMAENFFKKNAAQHGDHHDETPIALSYKDVDYKEFMKNVNFLRVETDVLDGPYEQD
jgi:saccharopine dehydrogenase-like NADP-dependent oxidoreductase